MSQKTRKKKHNQDLQLNTTKKVENEVVQQRKRKNRKLRREIKKIIKSLSERDLFKIFTAPNKNNCLCHNLHSQCTTNEIIKIFCEIFNKSICKVSVNQSGSDLKIKYFGSKQNTMTNYIFEICVLSENIFFLHAQLSKKIRRIKQKTNEKNMVVLLDLQDKLDKLDTVIKNNENYLFFGMTYKQKSLSRQNSKMIYQADPENQRKSINLQSSQRAIEYPLAKSFTLAGKTTTFASDLDSLLVLKNESANLILTSILSLIKNQLVPHRYSCKLLRHEQADSFSYLRSIVFYEHFDSLEQKINSHTSLVCKKSRNLDDASIQPVISSVCATDSPSKPESIYKIKKDQCLNTNNQTFESVCSLTLESMPQKNKVASCPSECTEALDSTLLYNLKKSDPSSDVINLPFPTDASLFDLHGQLSDTTKKHHNILKSKPVCFARLKTKIHSRRKTHIKGSDFHIFSNASLKMRLRGASKQADSKKMNTNHKKMELKLSDLMKLNQD